MEYCWFLRPINDLCLRRARGCVKYLLSGSFTYSALIARSAQQPQAVSLIMTSNKHTTAVETFVTIPHTARP
ncbi:hypothetical protein CLAIMM_00880 [Cladophialophora immunda]|nr:hypothetical protein CLAIMM_00880 [Cladophialophora immunda]